MIHDFRAVQWKRYNEVRAKLAAAPAPLIELEKMLASDLYSILCKHTAVIQDDYDEASFLNPFWQNYPPDDRGNNPVKDQYPWIEVGEHAIGAKLPRMLEEKYSVRDSGFPTGADQRFVLKHPSIAKATAGITDSAWLFIDIKSVGPRDDFDHTVMSHNQVSGDGRWDKPADGVVNSILTAKGKQTSHDFHASLPPLFVLSDGTVAPLVTVALKPVYEMIPAPSGARNLGQPLRRIDLACIPNGLLLTTNPNYLKKHPGLLFPGKDDKGKNPKKLRARVSFELLRAIAPWRVQSLTLPPR